MEKQDGPSTGNEGKEVGSDLENEEDLKLSFVTVWKAHSAQTSVQGTELRAVFHIYTRIAMCRWGGQGNRGHH
jgi:hypothetical protein